MGRRRGGGRRARSSPAHTTSIALLRPGDRAGSVLGVRRVPLPVVTDESMGTAKVRDARVKGTTRARAAVRTTTGTMSASRPRREESRGRLARARVLRGRMTTRGFTFAGWATGESATALFAQRLGANIRRGVSRGVSELRKVETSEPMQGLRDFFGKLGGASGGSSGAGVPRLND